MISVIVAICSCIRSKKTKEISCLSTTLDVIKAGSNAVPELSISYKGQPMENMAMTQYAIWNSGTEVLNWTDIAEASPLRIVCNDNVKILDLRIISQSEKSNGFMIEDKDGHSVEIHFDYARAKDGIVLRIIHTGRDIDIRVECKIKGGKVIKNVSFISTKTLNKIAIELIRTMCIYIISMAMGLIVLTKFKIITNIKITDFIPGSGYVVNSISVFLTLAMWMVFMILFWIRLDGLGHKSVPDDLLRDINMKNINDIFGGNN
jgi:hypothetical protein